jgi:DNA-binding transcriptional LysR family regulator
MINPRYSLSAISAFTVAAQELNFSRAADILHITPSAVSHRIKQLESQLGVTLFIRHTQGVKLTTAGQSLLNHAQLAMNNIQHGIEQSQFSNGREKLNIAIIPSLSQCWLIPRFQEFKTLYPEFEITLTVSDQLVDFSSSHIDCHLHFGTGQYQGLTAHFLSNESVYPVCHPSLLQKTGDLITLIEQHGLLHYKAGLEDEPGSASWAQWCQHFNITLPSQSQNNWFSHVSMALCSARYSQGIALGWHKIVEQDIAQRQLIKIGDDQLTTDFNYYLVAPNSHWQKPAVIVFKDWLVSQMDEK